MKTNKKTAVARHKAKIRAGRPVHKRFLLHPATIFLMLCTGVLLFGWTWRANASGPTDTVSYTVHGRIPAAPLTEPATITSPLDGQHYTSVPINVGGTCPDDSYVKLYRNSIFSGVAICSGGTFSIQTDLFSGANNLQGRVFNVTDDEGPVGNIVTVYYEPASPAVAQNQSPAAGQPGSPAVQPLLITSDYRYVGYLAGEQINWQIEVRGGLPPFGFTVDWGDNHRDTYVQKEQGILTIEHTYKTPGTYTIKIQAADGAGEHASLSLVSIVKSSRSPLISIGGSTISLSPSQKYQWVWLAWPAYLMVLLMMLSYWLGERQELWILSRAKRPSRRRSRR